MRRESALRLTAGQVDTGLNSLATLAIGLYAVRVFDIRLLGAYAVLFTAWNFARALPTELVFLPSEVVAISHREPLRLQILRSSLKRGGVASLLSAFGVAAAGLFLRNDVAGEPLLGLTATAALLAIISPAQDHIRRVFHMSGASWPAASVAAVHLAVTAGAILALDRAAPQAWTPFGALAIGMLVSLAYSLALCLSSRLRSPAPPSLEQPSWGELRAMGGWLLFSNLTAEGADFALALIVQGLMGPEILGFAEGARVVSRPVGILGLGLMAVLGPTMMEAGAHHQPERARKTRGLIWRVAIVGGLAYLAFVGFDWALNPLPSLLPNAYAVAWLVPVTILGTVVLDLGLADRARLMGARRQPLIARVEVSASVIQVATGFFAGLLEAFTLPVAWSAGWTTRTAGYLHYSRQQERAPTQQPKGGSV